MGPVGLFMGHPGPPRIAQNAHFFTLGPIYEKLVIIFSSAVPPGSGAFQMPTCPSSSAASAASASTLRGGRANLRNASVTFSLFLHEASLG